MSTAGGLEVNEAVRDLILLLPRIVGRAKRIPVPEALRTYENALRLASDGTSPRGIADMYVGMSQIACERNDLDSATQYLLRSHEFGELPQNPYRRQVAMARIREAEGDLGGALELLDEAQRVYMGDFSPNVQPVQALRARVLAAHGHVSDALSWARERGLSSDGTKSEIIERLESADAESSDDHKTDQRYSEGKSTTASDPAGWCRCTCWMNIVRLARRIRSGSGIHNGFSSNRSLATMPNDKTPAVRRASHDCLGWRPTRPLRAGLLFGAVLRTADAPANLEQLLLHL
jgi:hypothetical protein